MAALPAGVQYGLSSESSYKDNKELVFVKLTDSALKAIEDFIRNNRDKLAKPKIQFLPGNEGKISIPGPASANGSTAEATFRFSLNSNAEMEGPQGSFECVRSGGARRLESCGPLPRRMRVHANDDSYEATKDRMARTVAAEQSKCTRVIKPNQTDIGRIKVRPSHQAYSSAALHQQLAERAADRAERPVRPERSERPERPERTERQERPERQERERQERERQERERQERERQERERQERERQERERQDRERQERERQERERQERERQERERQERERQERERQERAERQDRPERLERPQAGAPPPRSQPALTHHQPHPPHQLHPPHPPHPPQLQRQPPNPDLTRRPIKERLIQLLALKPFKKPELYVRLNSEGIKEKERGIMNKILSEICSLKDNCYHLRRHVWNDVNEDWSFYTEEEKRTLKRRKPQNLTPPVSSDSAASLSPRGSPGKRGAAGDEPPVKKQRISRYRRPSPSSSGYATGGSGASSGERHASDNEDDRTVKKDNGYTLNYNTDKEIPCNSPVKPNGFRSSPPVEQTSNITVTNDITNTDNLENTDITSAPDDNTTDLDDFERVYPPIMNSSKRRVYKNEFTELYKEYAALYKTVTHVAEFFTQLERQLKRAKPNTPEHQSIEQRIVSEYKRSRNDAEYQKQRRRLDYLHRKLEHIKRMVQQYDDLLTLNSDRVSTASTTQAY